MNYKEHYYIDEYCDFAILASKEFKLSRRGFFIEHNTLYHLDLGLRPQAITSVGSPKWNTLIAKAGEPKTW